MKVTFSLFFCISALVSPLGMAEMEQLNIAELASHVGGQVWPAEVVAEQTNIKNRDIHVIGTTRIISPRLTTTPMNGQVASPSAGITLDMNLQMYIEEVRWTDSDGAGPNGRSGSVSLQGISIGHLDGLQPSAAIIKGVTVDVDGRDGLLIGVGEVGDRLGNGIDLKIETIHIGR